MIVHANRRFQVLDSGVVHRLWLIVMGHDCWVYSFPLNVIHMLPVHQLACDARMRLESTAFISAGTVITSSMPQAVLHGTYELLILSEIFTNLCIVHDIKRL